MQSAMSALLPKAELLNGVLIRRRPKYLGVNCSNVYGHLVKARGKGKQKNRLKKAEQKL